MSNWRFIPFSEHDGATNMAVDIVLLEKALESAPVLRLYGFSPPCLSIGLNQKIDPAIHERTREKGFDIVRRPSGGRAVLHYMDLTYAFIASEKNSGSHGILEHSVSNAYKQICLGLQEAFSILGVRTELGSAQAAYRHLADCFLATTNADLHHNGKKLAGSAQLRRHNCVLQHGSVPLALEQDAMAELLGERQAAKAERHANLFEILSRKVEISELNGAMRRGFEKAFEIQFDSRPLSQEELKAAESRNAEYLYSLASAEEVNA